MSPGDRSARLVRQLGEAAGFLTPLGRGGRAPSPESMTFFPVVGLGLGLATGAVWKLARARLRPVTAAIIVQLVDLGLTRGMHFDGAADAADGLLAHAPTKSRLDIMSEPQIGVYGVIALTSLLGARTAALAELDPSPVLLGALWCVSRSLMVLGIRTIPYAREDGLAGAFVRADAPHDAAANAALLGIATSAIAASLWHGQRGALSVLAGTLAGAGVLSASRRRIGGFTGDVLGAAGVTCETVGLMAAARVG
jgi:adenosylcobinamide-GDP ribazoletransferase